MMSLNLTVYIVDPVSHFDEPFSSAVHLADRSEVSLPTLTQRRAL